MTRSFAMIFMASGAFASPADSLPQPQPERCLGFVGAVGDANAVPDGLNYGQVSAALNGVIQTALQCERPPGLSEAHLTFDLVVGCDGLVESIDVLDTGGAPDSYAQCVASVIEKADFPAHDRQDGMPVTYPVDVAW